MMAEAIKTLKKKIDPSLRATPRQFLITRQQSSLFRSFVCYPARRRRTGPVACGALRRPVADLRFSESFYFVFLFLFFIIII